MPPGRHGAGGGRNEDGPSCRFRRVRDPDRDHTLFVIIMI